MAQPLKSHILTEIAGDLEDLYEYHRAKGLTDEEAARYATEQFDVSDDALEDLVKVHQTFSVRLSSTIYDRLKSRWEAALLLFSLLAVFYIAGMEAVTLRIFDNASYFIWPVLATGGLVVLQAVACSWVLYVRRNPNIRKMRIAIQSLLVLGGVSLFIGVTGYFAELYLAENYLLYLGPLFIIIMHEGRPDFVDALQHMPVWYLKGAALMMCSLSVSVLSGVLWYLLFNKLHNVEQRDLAALLDDETVK